MSKAILVIDDDAGIREVLSDVLADEGYTVATAANGREALGYLKQHGNSPPGLILLDLMMPVMDGWAFLDAYAADSTLPSAPVVVLSANLAATGGEHRDDVLLYLRKPLDLERLLETVSRWCIDHGNGSGRQAAC